MQKILTGTRYLIVIPVVGLVIASAFFFVFGGIGLIRLLFEFLVGLGEQLQGAAPAEEAADLLIVSVVEFVHTFLVGTVLFITAVGLYQLFITEIQFPGWLKIDSTEDLETNLIGVTVVVLAVNFMSRVFLGESESVLHYGVGIALPIAALGLFVGLRAWAAKMTKERHHGHNGQTGVSAHGHHAAPAAQDSIINNVE